MPKALFTLALVSFMFPFLLITCNDKSTIEYKPMVFQDQYVYPIQGYKLAFGINDKSGGLFENKKKSKLDASIFDVTDSDSEDENGEDVKEKHEWNDRSGLSHRYDKNAIYWQVLLVTLMLVSLLGVVFSFLNKRRGYSEFNLKILSFVGMGLLLLFMISIYYSEDKIHSKTEAALKNGKHHNSWLDSLDNIEVYIGFGSGIYLCFFSYLLLLIYFYYFSKRYVLKLEKNQEPIIVHENDEPIPENVAHIIEVEE